MAGHTHALVISTNTAGRAITSALGGVARPERAPDSAGCDPLRQPGLCIHPGIAHRQLPASQPLPLFF